MSDRAFLSLYFAVIFVVAFGMYKGLTYLYDNRQDKCVVSIADAISTRPEMMALRERCEGMNQ